MAHAKTTQKVSSRLFFVLRSAFSALVQAVYLVKMSFYWGLCKFFFSFLIHETSLGDTNAGVSTFPFAHFIATNVNNSSFSREMAWPTLCS